MMSPFTHELSNDLMTLRGTAERDFAEAWALLEKTFTYITALEYALGVEEVVRIQRELT